MLWLSKSLVLALLFLIFHSHVISSSSSSRPPCRPETRTSLLNLSSNTASNFNKSADCCTWDWVYCDEKTGHVTGLHLSIRNETVITPKSSLFSLSHLKSLIIDGSYDLNTKFGSDAFDALTRNLTSLQSLDFEYINMSSVPPASLMNLSSSLISLGIHSCQLTGKLPHNFFHFPNLEFLDLSENNLGGQLQSMCSNCTLPSNLADLSLYLNSFSGPIPSWIFSLQNLEWLILNNNLFSGEIGEFQTTSLSHVWLSNNKLQGAIPGSLFQQMELKRLDISSNNFTGQLQSMCSNCTLPSNLTTLSVSDNSFSGSIPSWIYSLPNLEELYLRNNRFSGEIGEFQTTSLFVLSLSNNTLQGAIPRSLFQQMELQYLYLSSNNFTGTVELQELSKLSKLYRLDLSDNSLTLTDNCTNCTFENLTYLGLSSCNLTQFPHFLRSSKQIHTIDLSNNQIQGIVPKWLRELKNLNILDLRSNLFFGSLPNFPPLLAFLFVSRNQFSGEIPSSICNVTSLFVLDSSYNNLRGRIPPCIGNVKYLSVLDLRSNKLHGEIPESLFVKESRLQNLNLNGNQLEGQIPRSLVNCTKLEILDLGNNEFNDTFPEWLESLPMLQVLVLRANKFHGLIGNPKPIFPFQNLRIMDLSHNHFTGDLPTKYFDNFKAMKIDTRDVKLSYVGDEIGYYHASVRVTMKGSEIEMERIQTIFTTIDFSCNNFIGEIPESLGKLKSLKGLNLSHNMLTGILPPSLGNLTNIEWLDLSSNELVGNIPVELADIPWLSNLNLSYNHLEGPIPRGTQFNTFLNESFEGNLNLCGFPLSKSCGGDTKPPEPSLVQDDEDDDDSSNWRIVMMGFASGLVIGISMGYMLLYSNGKLHWLSERILEEIEYRRAMRPKKRNARRSWRR